MSIHLFLILKMVTIFYLGKKTVSRNYKILNNKNKTKYLIDILFFLYTHILYTVSSHVSSDNSHWLFSCSNVSFLIAFLFVCQNVHKNHQRWNSVQLKQEKNSNQRIMIYCFLQGLKRQLLYAWYARDNS